MSARQTVASVVTPNASHGFWQQQVVTENTITSRYRRRMPTLPKATPTHTSPLEKVARKRHFTFCAELPVLLTENVNSKLATSPLPRRLSPPGQIRYSEFTKPLHIPSPVSRPTACFTQHFAGPYHLKPNGGQPAWEEVADWIDSNSRLRIREREARKILAKRAHEHLLSR